MFSVRKAIIRLVIVNMSIQSYINMSKYFFISYELLECLMVGKIFSQVSTKQVSILALVYLWYTTTEQNGMKNKNTISHMKAFNVQICTCIQGALKEYTNVSLLLELFRYCYMKMQYVERVPNNKRLTWNEMKHVTGEFMLTVFRIETVNIDLRHEASWLLEFFQCIPFFSMKPKLNVTVLLKEGEVSNFFMLFLLFFFSYFLLSMWLNIRILSVWRIFGFFKNIFK